MISTFHDPGPLKHTRPFNAMLRKSRRIGDCTDGKRSLGRQHVQRALITGSDGGQDNT